MENTEKDEATLTEKEYNMKVTHFKRLLDCGKPSDFKRQFTELAGSLNGDISAIRLEYYEKWKDEDVEALLNDVRKAALERGKADLVR